MKGLQFSVWVASSVLLGLILAYLDGVNLYGIVGVAAAASLLIAAVIGSDYALHVWQRRRSRQHPKPHEPPGRKDAEQESMHAVDLKRAFVMVSGIGIGFTIGSTLFNEFYAAIALGVVGWVASPFIVTWWNRRMEGSASND